MPKVPYKSVLPKIIFPLPEMVGLRIDKALSCFPEVKTRSRAEALIRRGSVLINGRRAKCSTLLRSVQDQIEILCPEGLEPPLAEVSPGSSRSPLQEVPPRASGTLHPPLVVDLNILYEDEDLIVINKPPGLVVHPAQGHREDTLVNALVAHTSDLSMKFGEDRPGIVHRLDKDTSGILVVAKNDFSHEGLSQQFRQRSIEREYRALIFGKPLPKEGTISSYLGRHPKDRKRFASIPQNRTRSQIKIDTRTYSRILDNKIDPKVHQGQGMNSQGKMEGRGKWAVTHYKVLCSHPCGVSLLSLKLETGRTHQIRVHCSEKGWPLLGDSVYGVTARRKHKGCRDLENALCPRLALHAARLKFQHPRTKEVLQFQVPWPSDLKPLLEKLGFPFQINEEISHRDLV